MSTWRSLNLLSREYSSGARVRYGQRKSDMTTALWVAFWLLVLTKGDPDLIDAAVALIGRLFA